MARPNQRPNQEAIVTFMEITGSSEAIAVQKLEEHGGDIIDAVNAHFNERDRNLGASSPGTFVSVFMDTDENPYPQHQRSLSHLSSAGNHSPSSSLLDSTVGRNIFDALSEVTNQSLFVTQPREVRETPIDVTDGNQHTPQAGHAPIIENVTGTVHPHGPDTHGTVPPAHYSHQDEQTNKILSDTSLGSDGIEEQMIRAAMENSLREFEEKHPNYRTDRQIDSSQSGLLGDLDLDHAISLSIKTAEQERARRSQRDVGALIVGPRNIIRSQAGSSYFQDEAEEAEEQPLIRNRSRPISLGSTDLAKKADVIETSTPSSSGNQDRINNPQHDRNVIHEEEPAPRPPSPSLTAQQADKEKELGAVEEAEAACEEERRREEESHKKLQEEKELETQLAAKEAAPPPEPSLDDEDAVTLLVKMPDGSRRERQFLRSDNLQSVFDFINIGGVVKPGTYRLVRPSPRRAFSDGESALTLNEVGLTSMHETLFLELI